MARVSAEFVVLEKCAVGTFNFWRMVHPEYHVIPVGCSFRVEESFTPVLSTTEDCTSCLAFKLLNQAFGSASYALISEASTGSACAHLTLTQSLECTFANRPMRCLSLNFPEHPHKTSALELFGPSTTVCG